MSRPQPCYVPYSLTTRIYFAVEKINLLYVKNNIHYLSHMMKPTSLSIGGPPPPTPKKMPPLQSIILKNT